MTYEDDVSEAIRAQREEQAHEAVQWAQDHDLPPLPTAENEQRRREHIEGASMERHLRDTPEDAGLTPSDETTADVLAAARRASPQTWAALAAAEDQGQFVPTEMPGTVLEALGISNPGAYTEP